MFGARGVSLGLGRINLASLHQLPTDPQFRGRIRRPSKKATPKTIVRKHVDKQTLWAACRAVIFGAIVIALGVVMTIVGYFDVEFAQEKHVNTVTRKEETVINLARRYQFKSLQYIGPILMGIGSFILIIACVITLESRDKHIEVTDIESSDCGISEVQKMVKNVPTAVTKRALRQEKVEVERPRRPPLFDRPDCINIDRIKYPSTSCIPHLLKTADTRRLYMRLFEDFNRRLMPEKSKAENRKLSSEEIDLARQNVIAEVHLLPTERIINSINSVDGSSNGAARRLRVARPPKGRAPLAEIDSLLDADISVSSLTCSKSSSSPVAHSLDQADLAQPSFFSESSLIESTQTARGKMPDWLHNNTHSSFVLHKQ